MKEFVADQVEKKLSPLDGRPIVQIKAHEKGSRTDNVRVFEMDDTNISTGGFLTPQQSTFEVDESTGKTSVDGLHLADCERFTVGLD